MSHPWLRGHDLLRIYYYDAPPATGNVTNPISGQTQNLGQTETHRRASALHHSMEQSPNIAVRRGDLAKRGWRIKERALKQIANENRALNANDLQPNIEQKGVDLRIGLDIARLSLNHLVSLVVVVTGDSDLIPAFKFARREGVRVFLHSLEAPIQMALNAHCDGTLEFSEEER